MGRPLPGKGVTWQYPRCERLANPDNQQEKELWTWATHLGLPLLFAYLGGMVLLARRVR